MEGEGRAAEMQAVLAGLQGQRDALQQDVAEVQARRDALQQDVVELQARLSHERNARQQILDSHKELEARLQTINCEIERNYAREQQIVEENGALGERVAQLEKEKMELDAELKHRRSEQQEQRQDIERTVRETVCKEEAKEEVKALQGKLGEEKVARGRAEQNAQDKERQLSMLAVDHRQIQQRLQKVEGEYRQVSVARV